MKSGFLLLIFSLGIIFYIFIGAKDQEKPLFPEIVSQNTLYTKPIDIKENDSKIKKTLNYLKINGKEFEVEILDTNEERIKGLSGRQSLENDNLILFIFEKQDFYGIWMKDMNFPIDIAWVDKDKKIITIKSNVSPSTYPQIFYPDSKAMYVIEANANFFDKNEIKIGSNIELIF